MSVYIAHCTLQLDTVSQRRVCASFFHHWLIANTASTTHDVFAGCGEHSQARRVWPGLAVL